MISAGVKRWRSVLRYYLLYRFTAYGLTLVISVLILFSYSETKPVFVAASFAAAAIFLCAMINRFYPTSVAVKPKGQCRLIAGQKVSLVFSLTNRSRQDAYNLSLRFPALPENSMQLESDLIPFLGAGRSVDCRVTLYFDRRGIYEIQGPVCLSSFPFNLFYAVKGRTPVVTISVYPFFGRIHGLFEGENNSSFEYVDMRSFGSGQTDEYIGSRISYLIESPRHIDARAWARLAVPAVREYRRQNRKSFAVFLQTCLRTDAGDAEADQLFEGGVSLAASLLNTFVRQEYKLSLFSTGRTVYNLNELHCFNHHEFALEVLAGVGREAQDLSPHTLSQIKEHLYRESSAVVFVVFTVTPAMERLISDCVTVGIKTLVLTVTNDHDGDKSYAAGDIGINHIVNYNRIFSETIQLV